MWETCHAVDNKYVTLYVLRLRYKLGLDFSFGFVSHNFKRNTHWTAPTQLMGPSFPVSASWVISRIPLHELVLSASLSGYYVRWGLHQLIIPRHIVSHAYLSFPQVELIYLAILCCLTKILPVEDLLKLGP